MEKKILTFFMYLFVCQLKEIECGKFFQIDNQTYYVSYPSKENWHIALRNCAYIGMALIDVPGTEEENRIVSIINRNEFQNDTRATFWTSGTDLGGEGNFYWATSGHSLIHTNWLSGQPDNYKSMKTDKMESQNCVWIADKWNLFRWDDNYCSTKSYYICRDKSLSKPAFLFTNMLNKDNSLKVIKS